MSTDVDRQIARSAELLQRISARSLQKRARSAVRRVQRIVKYATVSTTAIIVITLGWAILTPIGIEGVLLAVLAILVALAGSVLLSAERRVPAQALGAIDLKALPAATERWLDDQRPSLPAPAIPLVDGIGRRLDTLAPQLAVMSAAEPTAVSLRTLLAEHLPELVSGWRAIPPELRGAERNGRVPDRQLIDGLKLIDDELGELSETMAVADLDRLATHNRYLELRYRDNPDD